MMKSFTFLATLFLSPAAALLTRRLHAPSEFCLQFCWRGRLQLQESNESGDREQTACSKRPLLALPPIGSSSAHELANSVGSRSNGRGDQLITDDDFVGRAIVSKKFQISYTCKVCGHRNTHEVSRLAYRKGVVIAQCKGCFSRHWLADHLGWSRHAGGFDWDSGERDIEQYMQNRDFSARLEGIASDMESDLVQRVTQQVFDLETMLHSKRIDEESDISVGKDEDQSWS